MLRIVTFDGGPAPMLHVHVLSRLEGALRERGSPSMLAQTDMLAGASDGALMSLYLAMRLGARGGRPDVEEILADAIGFMDRYAAAFHEDMATRDIAAALDQVNVILDQRVPFWKETTLPAQLRALAAMPVRSLGDLWRAPLGGAALELWQLRRFLLGLAPLNRSVSRFRAVLEREFEGRTLGDLERSVAVLAFDTKEWAPRMFRNFGDDTTAEGRADRDRDLAVPVVDAILATMSLPLMFPIFGGPSGEEQRGYLDGIFAANNTAVSAVSLAIRHLVVPRLAAGKNPLAELRVLSLGATQTEEEATLERDGGLLRTLVLLLSHERETRMIFSVPPRDLWRYLRDPAVRPEFHRNLASKGVGAAPWGWGSFLGRPTLVGNLLIHGLNEEVSRQCARLLGDGGYHRLKIRINLARAIFTILGRRRVVSETDLPWNARRCFPEPGMDEKLPLSTDEIKNRGRTLGALRWIEESWFDEVPLPESPRPGAVS